jgi:hypothetical protein
MHRNEMGGSSTPHAPAALASGLHALQKMLRKPRNRLGPVSDVKNLLLPGIEPRSSNWQPGTSLSCVIPSPADEQTKDLFETWSVITGTHRFHLCHRGNQLYRRR